MSDMTPEPLPPTDPSIERPVDAGELGTESSSGDGGTTGFALILFAVVVLVAGLVYVVGVAGRAESETQAAADSAEDTLREYDPSEFSTEFDENATTVAPTTTVPDSLPLEAETTVPETIPEPTGPVFDPLEAAMVFVNRAAGDDYGKVGWVDFDGERHIGEIPCVRVDWNLFGGICLAPAESPTSAPFGYILDNRLEPTTRFGLNRPSRAAISPDGGVVAWTGFTVGHSYLAAGEFSTITQLIDVERTIGANLETVFTTYDLDGEENTNVDRNYWGVTFVDSDHFYATMGSGGETFIVEGRVSNSRIDVRYAGYSCPEISPDGSTIVAKEMVGDEGFRLVALDIASGARTVLGEDRLVDDQVEWLDDDTIVYALPNTDEGTTAQPAFDVWAVDITPGAQPRLLVPFAESPAVP